MPVILRGLFVRIRIVEAQVGEDLRADAVLARVGREAELDVGLHRVEPVLLELVGLQLRQRPMPRPSWDM